MKSDLSSLPGEKRTEQKRAIQRMSEGDRRRRKPEGGNNMERGEWYSGRDEEAHASLSEEVILAN